MMVVYDVAVFLPVPRHIHLCVVKLETKSSRVSSLTA